MLGCENPHGGPTRSTAGEGTVAGMRSFIALLLCSASLAACGGDDPEPLTIPGAKVFPEGIAVQKSTGDLFVGSTTDGAIYRGNVSGGEFKPFLPAGADGRTAVTGMKVDARGRLWVAGRFTEKAFVYDVATKRLLKTFTAPRGEPSFSPREESSIVNDLTLTDDAVYLTDSFRPVVYRIATEGDRIGRMEPWLSLENTPAAYRRGFNLNGISASDDGRYLLTVATDSGRLFRIDTQTKDVEEVDLGGETIKTADGLLLDGRTLLVVREKPGEIVPVRLSPDLRRGEVRPGFGRSELAFPTTLAERDGRVFVVNAQFDRADAPKLPFTVSALPLPDDLNLGE